MSKIRNWIVALESAEQILAGKCEPHSLYLDGKTADVSIPMQHFRELFSGKKVSRYESSGYSHFSYKVSDVLTFKACEKAGTPEVEEVVLFSV